MASGTIASRILGFIRTVVLALTIGVTTDAADAFGVANQQPNNVYAIIAGAVLSPAFRTVGNTQSWIQ
jgi:putative peptidoglycan lipid II flippase